MLRQPQMRLTGHTALDQVETLTNSFYKPKPRYGVDTQPQRHGCRRAACIGAGEVNVKSGICSDVFDSSYAHAGISTDFATNGSVVLLDGCGRFLLTEALLSPSGKSYL